MENKSVFGERLRKRRTECGLLQKELAEKVGITNRNISSYEKNDREPNYETLANIAKALDCSTDYLLGIVDEPNIFIGKVRGSNYEIEIDKNESDKPYHKEQFAKLINKLEEIGFDVEKLLGEQIDINK